MVAKSGFDENTDHTQPNSEVPILTDTPNLAAPILLCTKAMDHTQRAMDHKIIGIRMHTKKVERHNANKLRAEAMPM